MKTIKTIRSFVKRQRRLSPNQQKIFNARWEIYGLDISTGETPIKKLLNNNTSLALEIGFGMGTTLFNYAKKYPTQNFIGIEVYQPGVAALLTQLQTQPLNNIRIYKEDAILVLQKCIPNDSLMKVLIFFPDPWPKKRHHKRRLIQPEFIELLQKKLKSKGILHIATDWEEYANYIISVLKNNRAFTKLKLSEYSHILSDRIPTKFEQNGKKQGYEIADLLFIKQ